MKVWVMLLIAFAAVVLAIFFIPKNFEIKQNYLDLNNVKPILENGFVNLTQDCQDSSQECTTLQNVKTCLNQLQPLNTEYSISNYDKCLQIQKEYSDFYNKANTCLSIINQKLHEQTIECNKKPEIVLTSSCENKKTEVFPFNGYYDNLPIIKCTIESNENTNATIILKSENKTIILEKTLSQGINDFDLSFQLENNENTEVKKQIQISINNKQTNTLEFTVKPSNIIKWFNPQDEKPLVIGFSNPDDSIVQSLTAQAKEFTPTRTLDGYLSGYTNNVKLQAKALFNAVKLTQVSYVNDAIRFGNPDDSQKINTPTQSILKKSANCIDGALLISAMAESIGLESVIVFMPGHALVGIKLFPNASLRFNETYYLETTVISKDTPANANKLAEQIIVNAGNTVSFVDVKSLRNKIRPFPFKEQQFTTIPTPDQQTLDEIKGKNLDEEFYLNGRKGQYYCFESQSETRVYNTIDFTSNNPITFFYITKKGINTFETQGTFDSTEIEHDMGCYRPDALTHYESTCQTTNNYCLLFYYPGFDTARVKIKHYTTALD